MKKKSAELSESELAVKRQIERIVHGQIRHTMNVHPEFFTELGKERISSISKRIAGDVAAFVRNSSRIGKSEK